MFSSLHSLPLDGGIAGELQVLPFDTTHLGGDSCLVLAADPKPRLRWITELHERFVDAITQLGGPDSSTSSSTPHRNPRPIPPNYPREGLPSPERAIHTGAESAIEELSELAIRASTGPPVQLSSLEMAAPSNVVPDNGQFGNLDCFPVEYTKKRPMPIRKYAEASGVDDEQRLIVWGELEGC